MSVVPLKVPVNGNGHTHAPAKDLSRFSPKVREIFGEYVGAVNLNLGCGRNLEPGFYNVDRVAGPGIDAIANLEDARLPAVPAVGLLDAPQVLMPSASVDCVLASHVLEHIVNIIPLMREIHRVLKPGGYLLAVTPYASSDDAVEDPTHVRYFTERSWRYFDRRLYETPGHAGSYASSVDFCFDVTSVHLVPYPDIEAAAATAARQGAGFNALDVWKRTQRNVIREMIAVLRKVEG